MWTASNNQNYAARNNAGRWNRGKGLTHSWSSISSQVLFNTILVRTIIRSGVQHIVGPPWTQWTHSWTSMKLMNTLLVLHIITGVVQHILGTHHHHRCWTAHSWSSMNPMNTLLWSYQDGKVGCNKHIVIAETNSITQLPCVLNLFQNSLSSNTERKQWENEPEKKQNWLWCKEGK